MDLDSIWQDYNLDKLEAGMDTLFPEQNFSLSELLTQIFSGDIIGAFTDLFQNGFSDVTSQFMGMRNIFVWLLILGVVSALMNHFVEIFDKRQIADLSYYFIYLLMSVILLKCFGQAAQAAIGAIENIILFVKLLFPTYLIIVGVATGGTTVGAGYQLVLLLIYGVESILLGVALPLVHSFVMLSVVNGIWVEEKLSLLIEFIEKCINWILKAALGLVTGISLVQAVVTPAVDSMKSSVLQKVISVIPGIGNAAEGVMELVIGSATMIKNGVGVVLLILLLVLCAAPLLKIFLTAVLLKAAAAFMGIVSDKRITSCANHTGDAGMLLFRILGTAMLLFLITIAIGVAIANRRI